MFLCFHKLFISAQHFIQQEIKNGLYLSNHDVDLVSYIKQFGNEN